ncbi:MAG: hypothetical protein KME21_17500 [Desmonostoc vinosum HA7617-LM4]|nr:hypothetical protein [Desmonostoc vinosum HA7617-LM4]
MGSGELGMGNWEWGMSVICHDARGLATATLTSFVNWLFSASSPVPA